LETPNSKLPTRNSQLETPNSKLVTSNSELRPMTIRPNCVHSPHRFRLRFRHVLYHRLRPAPGRSPGHVRRPVRAVDLRPAVFDHFLRDRAGGDTVSARRFAAVSGRRAGGTPGYRPQS